METPFGRLGPLEERFHGPRGHLVADGGVGPSSVAVRLDELDDDVLGGWFGHARRPFVVVGMHSKGLVPLACVSERTIQVTSGQGQTAIRRRPIGGPSELARIVGNAPNACLRGSSVAYLRL